MKKIIPEKPGCYLFKNNDGVVIYVGKAKNLKKRVNSYFSKKNFGKTAKMVLEIDEIEYFIVTNETEALILELNLIKKYSPKYNILLRDDKTYPYIELTNEKVPVLKIVRRLSKKKDLNRLFGPYPNVMAARKVVNLLNRIYPLRKCRTYAKKACLYYHIKQCKGYCINDVKRDEILEMEKEIISFLMGNYKIVVKKIENEMLFESNKQNYESAKELKDLLEYVKITLTKQKVEINDLLAIDVFGYYYKDNYLAINTLFIRGGKIVEFVNNIYEIIGDVEETLINYVARFYDNKLKPKEVLIDISDRESLTEYLNTVVKKPQRGSKKNIVKMASLNAKLFYEDKILELKKTEKKEIEVIGLLKELLNLEKLEKIEFFDNSTLFGTNAVSVMVAFDKMKPLKKDYRKYKLIDQHDDYDSLREVLKRRYSRFNKPDLVMVDGGIGHVKVAVEVLGPDVAIVGIYKNEKHQTEGLVTLNEKIELEKNSDLYRFINLIQEEGHRFAINYHRKIRSKGSLTSVLDDIPFLGEKSREKLLKKFLTISEIKKADDQELLKIINKTALINLRKKLGSEKDE